MKLPTTIDISWKDRLPRSDKGGNEVLDGNFYRYLTGFALSAFGDTVALLALTFAVLDITGSAADLGFVLIAGRIPMIVFVVLGGVIGDRWPRKRVMICADLLRFATQAILALLLIEHRAHLWQIALLHGLGGAAFAFFSPAASGLVRDVVQVAALQRANGLLNFVRNTSSMVALGVSSLLVVGFGPGWALAIDAVTFALSAVFIFSIQMSVDSRMSARPGLLQQLKDGFVHLYRRMWIMVLVIHGGIINGCVIAPILILGPLVAKTHLAGAYSWATIGMGTTCGALAGSVLGIRCKTNRLLPLGIGVVFGALPMIALLAVAAPTVWITASAVLFGAQSSFYLTATQTVMQQRVEGAVIARISAYVSLGGLVLMPLGLALAGPAAERFGTSNVLWFAAASLVASTVAALAFPQIWAVDSLTNKIRTGT